MKPAEPVWRSALALAVIAVLATALLSAVDRLTAQRIAEQEQRAMREQLEQVLDPSRYDNRLEDDMLLFSDEMYFPGGQVVQAYRARRNGQPVAVVLRFAATGGYNGDIDLLVGILRDGSLSGVRVLSHRETPGLGDLIELRRSAWLEKFDGKSLENPVENGWAVRRDGGEFDQFTGATITPRAVVEAVRDALKYHRHHADQLYGQSTMNDRTEPE